jgi:hypothetical protein
LPHSEIRGSTGARPSPRLFAACHVLHRLSTPRHPPDALPSLAPHQPPPETAPPPEASHPVSRPGGGPRTGTLGGRPACASSTPMPTTVLRRSRCCARQRGDRERPTTTIRCPNKSMTAPPPAPRGRRPRRSRSIPAARPRGAVRSGSPRGRKTAQGQPLVGPGRLERPTSRLSGVRSNQLSYGPKRPERRRRAPRPEGRSRAGPRPAGRAWQAGTWKARTWKECADGVAPWAPRSRAGAP